MNLIQYAIASIVDANTGYVQSTHNRQGRQALGVQGSLAGFNGQLANYLQRGAHVIDQALAGLQKQQAKRRNLKQLSALNNHLLEDIGLTRADIQAAELGQVDLDGLERIRLARRDDKTARSRRNIATHSVAISGKAVNEANFAAVKCA